MSWFVLTNTVNLARTISFGCLGPRPLYGEKYKADASELVDGALPLFSSPPASSLVEECCSEGAHPVLLELHEATFGTGEAVVLSGSLVPATAIRLVHFRSGADEKEYLTTPFDNVDPESAFETAVSPEFFEGVGGPSLERSSDRTPATLLGEDGASPAELPMVSAEAVELIDRRAGGLAEMCRPGSPSRDTVKLAARILEAGLADLTADPFESTSSLPEDERGIHRAVCAVLIGTDPQDRAPAKILEAVESRWPETRQLNVMARIMKGRADLEALPAETGPVERALLLALLADTPAGARDRIREDAVADGLIQTLALFYSGLRRGHARIPTRERIGELEEELAQACARAGRAAAPPSVSDPPEGIQTSFRREADAFAYLLQFGGDPFPVGRVAFEDPADRLRDVIGPGPIAVAVAEALGIDVMTTIELPSDSTMVINQKKAGGARIAFKGPILISREADAAKVQKALGKAGAKQIRELADRYAPVPGEAP